MLALPLPGKTGRQKKCNDVKHLHLLLSILSSQTLRNHYPSGSTSSGLILLPSFWIPRAMLLSAPLTFFGGHAAPLSIFLITERDSLTATISSSSRSSSAQNEARSEWITHLQLSLITFYEKEHLPLFKCPTKPDYSKAIFMPMRRGHFLITCKSQLQHLRSRWNSRINKIHQKCQNAFLFGWPRIRGRSSLWAAKEGATLLK